jgi:hypothetical protein
VQLHDGGFGFRVEPHRQRDAQRDAARVHAHRVGTRQPLRSLNRKRIKDIIGTRVLLGVRIARSIGCQIPDDAIYAADRRALEMANDLPRCVENLNCDLLLGRFVPALGFRPSTTLRYARDDKALRSGMARC